MARDKTKERNKFHIDPIHEKVDIYAQEITQDIWKEKYSYQGEEHPHDSMRRVCEGVYSRDQNRQAKWDGLEAMVKALWVPAGRIQAGAGTTKIVTQINCFVDRNIEDSMNGIADALKDAMLTMQQGGGIGMDFSTLRPSGAHLQRTGAVASGPLPFMDMWDAMCATIMSAGSRRGAMMATMSIEHPDIMNFIKAKQTKGKLTNFNVSVLVTDAFMDALANDEDWYTGFGVPMANNKHLFATEKEDEGKWYAYDRWSAKELWAEITKNTYEWSEPGVIFIDRINDRNNLNYCETITCTNPCGEQPLPPNGACLLGAINLARMVIAPFTPDATFNFSLLKQIAKVGTRFLDNVIETSIYPLPEQQAEEMNKRRIGLGILGLGNCLEQLRMIYGSPEACDITDLIMAELKESVYSASCDLAKERGTFPFYDSELWGKNDLVRGLTPALKRKIAKHGIRNGVLLTIAPTGTTAIGAGNVSSGLEPVFLHAAKRNVRQPDGKLDKEYIAYDYGMLLYNQFKGQPDTELPEYMCTHADVSVRSHLHMQEVCQRHIDASVSKTINVPKDTSYAAFKDIYTSAYKRGLKGCTTYRPSDVRGSVLSAVTDEEPTRRALTKRPSVLEGPTYKLKWPNTEDNYYLTINSLEGKPFEMFINSTSSKYTDWTTALCLLISAIMRRGDDISFLPKELKKVISLNDVGFVDGKFYGSLVALIGDTLEVHLANEAMNHIDRKLDEVYVAPQTLLLDSNGIGDICPKCNMPTLYAQESCMMCTNCGYSNCG